MDTAARVAGILAALKECYPDALCALQYEKGYELMIAVRLSAQCTDARVNLVTPALFARFDSLDAFADAQPEDVEPYIRSCGFFRAKARDIVLACRRLREVYGGRIPDTMDQLLTLPGVGRKTRRRSSSSCGRSSRPRRATTSATGWCSTAARSAAPVRPAAGTAVWRPGAAASAENESDFSASQRSRWTLRWG